MTVKELIEVLSNFPEDMKVKILDDSGLGDPVEVYKSDSTDGDSIVVIM
jgi:hypothetical protein